MPINTDAISTAMEYRMEHPDAFATEFGSDITRMSTVTKIEDAMDEIIGM